MALYVIEIGLDAKVAPRYDDTYSHLINLIQVDDFTATQGNPSWFTRFKPDDWIVFRACDYTERPKGDLYPKLELKGMFVKFLDPQNPKCLSDCVDEPLLCSGKDYYPEEGGSSLVVPGKTGWRFFGTPFENMSTERFCTFSPGYHRALLRVSVVAKVTPDEKAAEEFRWFTHDPEIIVGEGGFYKPPRRWPSSPRRR